MMLYVDHGLGFSALPDLKLELHDVSVPRFK